MKRCPECRRDYYDDSLLYCLDDGTPLATGPIDASDVDTAIMLPVPPDFGRSARKQSTPAPAKRAPRHVNSIAVLPFVNVSADPENDYFCDGLSEELLNALAKVQGLKVAARTSAFSFKGKNLNIDVIGKTLRVDTVLEGSVRRSGNRLRVTAQLVNVADGYDIWSERYDRELKDVFDVQDEITLAIVDTLKLKLLGDRRAAVLRRYTDNAEAYSLYLHGRFFWNKRTTEGALRAIEYFEKAIALDPNYALAYSGIADCYNTSGFAYDLGSVPAREVISKAKSAASKALEIDDSLAEAHSSLAYAKHLFDWDFAGAEELFRKALELNPNYADARHWYAHLLVALSRFDEALLESKRALELDPVSPVMNNHLGWHYMYARQYDLAIAQLNHTFALDPEFALSQWYLGIVYEQLGRNAEAEAAFEAALRPTNADALIRADVAHYYAVSGQTERALEELAALEKIAKEQRVSPFGFAMIQVGMGDHDKAFAFLERAFDERSDMLVYLNVDPRLDPLRENPRFADLTARVGLPDR